jgi:hypothetical protein
VVLAKALPREEVFCPILHVARHREADLNKVVRQVRVQYSEMVSPADFKAMDISAAGDVRRLSPGDRRQVGSD